MNPIRILAIVLILAGALGLAYRGFTYTTETHEAQIGSLELSAKENKRVTIPPWLSGAAIGGGLLLLLFGGRERA